MTASCAKLTYPPQHPLFPTEGGAAPISGDVYCFGELDCLVTGPEFFHPQYRPINQAPQSRQHIRVSFHIQTREDHRGVTVPALDRQQFYRSSFRPNRKTKVIIHGFLNGQSMPWLRVSVYSMSWMAFFRESDLFANGSTFKGSLHKGQLIQLDCLPSVCLSSSFTYALFD